MKMKTRLKGAISEGGKLRLWTGIPVGIGVTYAAGKVMPDFTSIQSAWVYGLPYCAPAVLLGLAATFSDKYKRAGYGILGSTAAYYLWATISNLTAGSNSPPDVPTEYKDYSKSTTPPPGTTVAGAAGVKILR